MSALTTQLTEKYGRSFEIRNLRRMINHFLSSQANQRAVNGLITTIHGSYFIIMETAGLEPVTSCV